MKKPLILIACLALAGCTDADWNRMLNYGGGDEVETQAPPAPRAKAPAPRAAAAAPSAPASQPVAVAPPANSDFCKGIATQDATGNGYDPATQQRVLAQSYSQCLNIYNR